MTFFLTINSLFDQTETRELVVGTLNILPELRNQEWSSFWIALMRCVICFDLNYTAELVTFVLIAHI
jgi:hypothetical protein